MKPKFKGIKAVSLRHLKSNARHTKKSEKNLEEPPRRRDQATQQGSPNNVTC